MILRSRNVVTPEGIRAASIHINDGVIERIADFDDAPEAIDYGELTLMPGVVDSHVHVNEPGRTEWEGFATATRAAAAGGATTIVDMPLNSIPATTTVEALQIKAAALEGQCAVDVALWGGAVPGNAPELLPMLAAGARGFKCFLVESGVAEFGHLDRDGLRLALETLRESGAPLLVHAELAGPIEAATAQLTGDVRSYRRYLASRPCRAEDEAIALVAEMAEATGGRAHIVHLSSASAVPILRNAMERGVALTAETTPHYLFLDAESIPDGAPQYKCAPPIRERANREWLWTALKDGVIQAIVSDHSPCTPELKHLHEGDVAKAWGGIASLQFALPIAWTAARERNVPLTTISSLMSEGPATIAGLQQRKGRLAAGFDADVIAFAPEERFTVDARRIRHRHRVTPYVGRELFGVVHDTWLRGERVFTTDATRQVEQRRGVWVRG